MQIYKDLVCEIPFMYVYQRTPFVFVYFFCWLCRLYYGVKCDGDEVILKDFIVVLQNLSIQKQKVQPSQVLRLFWEEKSYRTELPDHYYISKEYVLFIYLSMSHNSRDFLNVVLSKRNVILAPYRTRIMNFLLGLGSNFLLEEVPSYFRLQFLIMC